MWSGDSTTTVEELDAAVRESGLDVLCITDHNRISGAQRLVGTLPCRVIVGEEIKTAQGELIGLFLTEHVPAGLTPHDTARAIRSQGGLTYLPHPFDPVRYALDTAAVRALAEDGLLDAIEVFNAKTSLSHLNRQAAELACELGCAGGAGSDAHVPDALGAAFVEMSDFVDATSFLVALRGGEIVGHHWDKPRPWSPRIVPSTP
jgi:predicted metal-dependent phosphoesterase TrpH